MAGGGVRDLLCKIVPHDIDFATDAEPDQMISMMRCVGFLSKDRIDYRCHFQEFPKYPTHYHVIRTKTRNCHCSYQQQITIRDNDPPNR